MSNVHSLRNALGLTLVLAACTTLQAADYYVSPTGNDKAPGTSTFGAWKTIDRVNSATFRAGDRILFKGGGTFSGSVYLDSSDKGTAAQPITISSYGVGKATLVAQGENKAIFVYNASGIQITNLNVVGNPSASGMPAGILFYTDLPHDVKLPYIHITNVTVSGFRGVGIEIGAWNGNTGYSDVTITNVTLNNNAHGGLNVWGPGDVGKGGWAHRNVYVGYSRAFNNSGIAGFRQHSGSGFVIGDTDGGMIERSVAYNNGWLNTSHSGPVGVWAYNVNRFTIQHNESYGNRTNGGGDGGGFDLDGASINSVMQYNYSHDNDGPGFLICQYDGAPRWNSGNIVRYNISQNDGRRNGPGAIHLYSTVRNVSIYNNTVYLNQPASGYPRGLVIDGGALTVTIRNNIFVSTSNARLIDVRPGQTGVTFNGNNYWTGGNAVRIGWLGAEYSSLAGWRAATGQERLNSTDTGSSVDPKLAGAGTASTLGDASLLSTVNQYRLNADSPMIDAGIAIPGSGSMDFYSMAQPQGARVDVGASERSTAAHIAGLMASWPMDEGSGATAKDVSGNARSAALVNGPSWTLGQAGSGIAFDGVSSYVEVSSAMPVIEAGNYSISAWVRPLFTPVATDTNTTHFGLVMKRGHHFGLAFSSANRFVMSMFLNDFTHVGIESSATFLPGRFYHVIGVVDRARKQTLLYVDGQLAGSRTWDSSAPPLNLGTSPWTIGVAAPGATTYRWASTAVVDDVRMYNIALTSADVAAVFAR